MAEQGCNTYYDNSTFDGVQLFERATFEFYMEGGVFIQDLPADFLTQVNIVQGAALV